MTKRRIASVSMPHFAIERWLITRKRGGAAPPDDIPIALSTDGRHGPVIHAANRAARVAGVIVGARVVDMRAICPDLTIEYADILGDKRALQRLNLWARRWCPWTTLDESDASTGSEAGLILDTTGSAHLLGGEASLLADIQARFALMGITAHVAIAPTWGAAWALARYGPVRAQVDAGDLANALAPLPVSALRLSPETLILLNRLGLKTIGSLAAAPRLSLMRRFAKAALAANPLTRLDQVMGQQPEPVSSEAEPPEFIANIRLPEPIQDPAAHLPALCEILCDHLHRAEQGCRSLRLSVYRTDGEISVIEARTAAPSRDPDHLRGLFRDRIEQINPGFGFDLIRLEAGMVEPMAARQNQLDGEQVDDLALPHLLDRLIARLGAGAVTTPAPSASHIPERAEGWRTALQGTQKPQPQPQPQPQQTLRERPIRILRTPEQVNVVYAVPEGPPAQFIWRRKTLKVARYEGPERIAPEWWKDRPATRLRDYFKIEDITGLRLWLYREGLHDDGRGGDPRWFVHGMFA